MFYRLKDMDFKGKKVLLRADYNVPMDKSGKISDDSRIRKTLPTIEYILSKKPKQLIICSHLGRPEGEYKPEFSLKPVCERLKQVLGKEVVLDPNPYIRKITALPGSLIVILENVRFDKGEEENDDLLSQKLAGLADVFVFDAFGVSHRDQSSVTGVQKYLKSSAGMLMEKEITFLRDIVDKPKRPFAAIIGGAKEDKIAVIDKLIKKVDYLIVGGVLANTFMKAKGMSIGNSKYSSETVDYAKKILKNYPEKIHLPVDYILGDKFSPDANTRCAGLPDNIDGWSIMDIGPYTISGYKELLGKAKTIVWAGPIGVFELEKFRRGTSDIANFIAGLDAVKVIGGGDSGDAVEKLGLADRMSLVSTGGGASLEVLSGKVLPGIKALEDNYTRFKSDAKEKKR